MLLVPDLQSISIGELTLSELKAYTDATEEEQARIPSPETGQAYSAEERDISVCAGRFVVRIGIYVKLTSCRHSWSAHPPARF